MAKVKAGDKVRIISYYDRNLVGREGFVVSAYDNGFASVDIGISYYPCVDMNEFEVVEQTPSVTDLLANLALRVSELERHNREQAYEINELYKEVAK